MIYANKDYSITYPSEVTATVASGVLTSISFQLSCDKPITIKVSATCGCVKFKQKEFELNAFDTVFPEFTINKTQDYVTGKLLFYEKTGEVYNQLPIQSNLIITVKN
jgi:hypothetical protein